MPATAAGQSPSAQFLKALIKRNLEPLLEARIIGVTGHRCSDTSQTRLPIVLASLCRFALIPWTRIPNLNGLSSTFDSRFSDTCVGGAGLPSKQAPWIWAFFSWHHCGGCRLAWKISLGSQCNNLRCSGDPGCSSLWNAWPRRHTSGEVTASPAAKRTG